MHGNQIKGSSGVGFYGLYSVVPCCCHLSPLDHILYLTELGSDCPGSIAAREEDTGPEEGTSGGQIITRWIPLGSHGKMSPTSRTHVTEGEMQIIIIIDKDNVIKLSNDI